MNDITIATNTRITPHRWKFRAVNVCIYCGSNETLTDEHVVPYSLNGNIVLPKASCQSCANIINSEIETPLLQHTLRPARAYMQTQSRHSRKRPRPVKMHVRRPGSEVWAHEEVSEVDALKFCFGVELPMAGILVGKSARDVDDLAAKSIVSLFDLEGTMSKAAERGVHEIKFGFDLAVFMRFLVKVAHGYAVGAYGVDSFEHYLPSVILGRDVSGKPPPLPPHYVIGADCSPTPPTTDFFTIGPQLLAGWVPTLMGVVFKPFAFLPTLPSYPIVVGPMTSSGLEFTQ